MAGCSGLCLGPLRENVVAVGAGTRRHGVERRRRSHVAGEPALSLGRHGDESEWW